MLAVFCLRLACGLAAALLVLVGLPVSPRFFRTHFLTILGLTAVAAFGLWLEADGTTRLALGAALGLAFAGSVIWSLPVPYGGWAWVGLLTAALVWALVRTGGPALLNDLSAAALLGTALTAMLMGHFYLIATGMGMTPLLRLLTAFFAAVLFRALVAAYGLWSWTAEPNVVNLTGETVLLLPVRWGVGLLVPLVLGGMAWQAARIRSTQSATGILYVVVIFCFLGELLSQLLGQSDHYL
jgi:hypothetical protein